MSETLYQVSTIGGQELWSSNSVEPVWPSDTGNEVLEQIDPVFFNAQSMLDGVGLSIECIRNRAIDLASSMPPAMIHQQRSVVEDLRVGQKDISMWYLPSSILGIPELDDLYKDGLYRMAQLQAGQAEVVRLDPNDKPYCAFVTEVSPDSPRTDLHTDGRLTVITNLQLQNSRTMFGHPDLLKLDRPLTVNDLLDDERTIIMELAPVCGSAFNATGSPHGGLPKPGPDGYRPMLDADFIGGGIVADMEVYETYRQLVPDPLLSA